MKSIGSNKTLYGVMTVGAVIGFVASFLQMLEKLTLLKHADAALVCNLNSVFSCTNILNAWQSSVFGFPNTLLCIAFFALMITIGVVGWTGSQIHVAVRYVYQAMTLFFVGFGFWYLWESIFMVGALCIFCIFCYFGVLLISGAWFRLNYRSLRCYKGHKQGFDRFIGSGADIFVWVLIALAIVLEAIIKFR